jgi:hypothetical protein
MFQWGFLRWNYLQSYFILFHKGYFDYKAILKHLCSFTPIKLVLQKLNCVCRLFEKHTRPNMFNQIQASNEGMASKGYWIDCGDLGQPRELETWLQGECPLKGFTYNLNQFQVSFITSIKVSSSTHI